MKYSTTWTTCIKLSPRRYTYLRCIHPLYILVYTIPVRIGLHARMMESAAWKTTALQDGVRSLYSIWQGTYSISSRPPNYGIDAYRHASHGGTGKNTPPTGALVKTKFQTKWIHTVASREREMLSFVFFNIWTSLIIKVVKTIKLFFYRNLFSPSSL